jgi:hypothetical protein
MMRETPREGKASSLVIGSALSRFVWHTSRRAKTKSSADERRRDWRYSATLEVRLSNSIGISRNVSASGMYLEIDAPLVPGQSIAFTLMLDKAYPDVQLELHCTGTIVRVEPHGEGQGIAVTIDSWSLEPPTAGVAPDKLGEE